MQSDLQLLVRDCLSGRQSAMKDLVARFQNQVFGLCLRMLGHRQDAEDATQETFVRVLNNLHRWDPQREFEPWLLTIAGNRCRTRIAQRMRRPAVHSLEQPVADESHLQVEGNHLAEELQRALAGIRDLHRDSFLMFHQREMAYEEIADEFGVPLGTVKTWVHRARKELIARLRQRGVIAHERGPVPSV